MKTLGTLPKLGPAVQGPRRLFDVEAPRLPLSSRTARPGATPCGGSR